MSKTAVCTLFEGDYHYGLGALVNSLYNNGFRGPIWAGYRGSLPPWASAAKDCGDWHEFHFADDCSVNFVCLDTSVHFANYKPNFMVDVCTKYCSEVESIFYFDPDIVIKCDWSFYDLWIKYGIALCQEIVWGSMPNDHPVRQAWKEFFQDHEYDFHRELNQYFNSGFIGLKAKYISSLLLWKKLLDEILNLVSQPTGLKRNKTTDLFYSMDQDALNLMAMITPHPLTTIGPEGMDFIGGGFTMSHATGHPKPWQKAMTLSVLNGSSLKLADKEYWINANYPIQVYSPCSLLAKRVDLFFSTALRRFIR